MVTGQRFEFMGPFGNFYSKMWNIVDIMKIQFNTG